MRTTAIVFFTTINLLGACTESDRTHKNADTNKGADSTQVAARYQCPMDCEKGKTYEQGGKCPVCGMDLQ